jgi:hypothetical protein
MPKDDLTEFTRRLVEMANASEALMDGTMGPVLRIVADNEVVFGVWQDSAQPHGVGTLVVKGENHLREITATGTLAKCRVAAIKCVALEQAEALRQHVATDRTH